MGPADGGGRAAWHPTDRLGGGQYGADRGPGFVQINIDFVSAEHTIRTGRDRSPFELGLTGWSISARAISTAAARWYAEQARGVKRRLVGLDIEGSKPADHALLYSEKGAKRQIGTVSSALWSPTCKRNTSPLAMIDAPHFEPGGRDLGRDLSQHRELVWERRMARARIVERALLRARTAQGRAGGRPVKDAPLRRE